MIYQGKSNDKKLKSDQALQYTKQQIKPIKMLAHKRSLHNTYNLYLRYKVSSGGVGYYDLCIHPAFYGAIFDVPLIYDISIDSNPDTMLRYFVVKCTHAYHITHTPYVSSTQSESFTVSHFENNQADVITSAFYKKQPDFEICSPGFSDRYQCRQWWKKHSQNANTSELWKTHILLGIKCVL